MTARRHEFDFVVLVFPGWLIGWSSATIMKHLYGRDRTRRAFSNSLRLGVIR
ncbi:MAG TPA: hypothetical protein VND89_06960 [Acidimicrobiales bacterium]|nr:hypothetical protein [Acidimicrobiales bacterium]